MDFAQWRCHHCGIYIHGEKVVDVTFMPRVADHLETHKPKCYKIAFGSAIQSGTRFLSISGGGTSPYYDDPELQQIFDLIADHFMMDKSESLGEFCGYWDEESWGADPRKVNDEPN